MTTEVLTPPAAAAGLQCPICKSVEFIAFNGRDNARCAKCLSVERNRLLWMVLDKFGLLRMGLRVLHIAPELALAKRLAMLNGDRYHACDIDPARYTSRFTTVRPLDLCRDLVKMPSRCFDLIIHTHVLEHIACDVETTLREMERILLPGGHHFFGVPIRGDVTFEDLSDELMPQHRALMFGQEDHYRIFGKDSLREMLARVWGDEDPLLRPVDLFTEKELTRAGVPVEAWSGCTNHSLFHHQRPLRTRHSAWSAAMKTAAAVAAPDDAENAAVDVADRLPEGDAAARPRLLLHIGMPRGGARSIRCWLVSHRDSARDAGLDYWSAAEDHSQLMFYAFAGDARIARKEMWFQRSTAPVPTREESFELLKSYLGGLQGRTGFISAETLWAFTKDEIGGIADWLSELGVETSVLCFVQPPAEGFASAVQQRCQSNLALADLGLAAERTIPFTLSRLEHWLDAFGESRVVVRSGGGDVIAELRLALAGLGAALPLEAPEVMEPEPTIGLTAAKALLALNEWERRRARAGAPKRSALLRTTLLNIGGERFALPETVLARLQPAFAREDDFLTSRFGVKPGANERGIESIDDHRLLYWTADEVGGLLAVINRVLLAEEEKAKASKESA